MGITGQDGAYLAELLLGKNYIVHGIKRRSSSFNTDRIDHLYQDPHVNNRNFILHYGDLTDATNLIRIIQQVQPDEIYNLAAQSHVAVSFETPEYTANADGLGTLRILDAIRILGLEIKPVSTRLPHRNSTDSSRKPRKRKQRPSTRAAPTPSPSSTPTGSPSTTARPTASMRVTASCSTTKARSAAKPSSPEKSRAPSRALLLACRNVSTSAISPPCATGATPRITSKCNG